MAAAKGGDYAAVKQLLADGADVSCQDATTGVSPLMEVSLTVICAS